MTRLALTILLSILVAALSAHLAVATFFPNVIAAHYPPFAARIYDTKASLATQAGAARLEPIDGRPGILRVVLTQAAVDRLAIETAAVVERPVQRSRALAGVVLAGSAAPKAVSGEASGNVFIVRVPLSGAVDTPAPNEPAVVSLLAATNGVAKSGAPQGASLSAKAIGIVTEETPRGPERIAYYLLSGESAGVQPGTSVIAQVPLSGSGTPRRVIPAAAVLYDPTGRTWVYTNPQPLAFVREPVEIDAMEGDTAILRRGPAAGALVVKTGAFELFGAESAIGIEKVGH